MADVTRRMFLRHLRGAPTTWVRHVVRGKVAHEGTGLSFWYRPLTAVISEVPADDRGQPLDQVATLLAELAQQPALDLLARLPLTEALTAGVGAVRVAVSDALAGDARLTETGVRVVSARVVAVRPEPDLERALQTPTREGVQEDADRATYGRRARAVEQERAIAENELQNKIELSRRE